MISKQNVGRLSEQTLDVIKLVSPEFFISSLLMDETMGTYAITLQGLHAEASEFVKVPGYICNAPKYLGRGIENSHAREYLMENTVNRPTNSWTMG
jgi:hypothetical protein